MWNRKGVEKLATNAANSHENVDDVFGQVKRFSFDFGGTATAQPTVVYGGRFGDDHHNKKSWGKMHLLRSKAYYSSYYFIFGSRHQKSFSNTY